MYHLVHNNVSHTNVWNPKFDLTPTSVTSCPSSTSSAAGAAVAPLLLPSSAMILIFDFTGSTRRVLRPSYPMGKAQKSGNDSLVDVAVALTLRVWENNELNARAKNPVTKAGKAALKSPWSSPRLPASSSPPTSNCLLADAQDACSILLQLWTLWQNPRLT